MDDLIKRIESAAEADQYDLIGAAIILAHDFGWIDNATYDRAILMLNAGAYESAALTLVPRGWYVFSMGEFNDWLAQDNVEEEDPNKWLWRGFAHLAVRSDTLPEIEDAYSNAATPALAICAAVLKARKEEG